MSLQIGDKVNLKISDIAFGGEGVARIGDQRSEARDQTPTSDLRPPASELVVFVPFVIVGEEVEAEITEVKTNFARAKLLRVIQASPERVQPPCPYFGACGGCQYQHISYAEQLRVKHKQIADLFERVGKISPDKIAPVLPCPQPYGYRNRIMIRSQWNKPEQKLNIGFVRWDCGLVEDVEECKIAEPALNEQIQHVRAHPPPKGGIKVVLRIAPEGWDVPRDSFFQNNFFLLPKMVETVRKSVRDGGARHLIDLYCGVGFFGIELSSSVESFVGVEYDKLAIKAARNNAASRNIANGEFIAGQVEAELPKLVEKFSARATSVLLDPPRKGCLPQTLDLLRATKPAQVIYVSCHPATMARDLNILCRDGVFEIVKVTPLDMFPQTQHVECVADLRARATTNGNE